MTVDEFATVYARKVLEALNHIYCRHCKKKLLNNLSPYCSTKCEMFDALKGKSSTLWGPTVGWRKKDEK